MSFLPELSAARRALPRALFLAQAPQTTTIAQRAAFSTASPLQKTVVDSAKDTLKTVDRAVSDKLVDGIDTASTSTPLSPPSLSPPLTPPPLAATVASKLKETKDQVANKSAAELRGDAAELAGQAQGKASEMAGHAKGKASEVAGQAQGKASELTGKAQGTKEQVKGQAYGVKEEAKGQARGSAKQAAGTVKGVSEEVQREL